MGAMQALPPDAPIMQAWEKYKQSDRYKKAKYWAIQEQHTEGSIWAAFLAGYEAATSESVET